jgi:S1-C subfamily serine protease
VAAPPGPAGAAAKGLVITAIPPGSLLERIGLQPGDVIRSVNGEAVATEADVARIVQGRGLQAPLTAEVQRGGITVPINVTAPQR